MFYLVPHSERSPLDEAMKAFLCACLNETNRYLGGYYIALIFSHGSTEFHEVFFCASVQGTPLGLQKSSLLRFDFLHRDYFAGYRLLPFPMLQKHSFYYFSSSFCIIRKALINPSSSPSITGCTLPTSKSVR